MYADKVTTVSESYAQEIQTSYYGEGLDYALRMRGDDLRGIINGISYDKFNPATDKNLAVRYSKGEVDKKIANKVHIQQKLGLEVNGEKPLIGFISRLVEQKGVDLVQGVFDEIMATGAQFLILGTGFREYEEFFKQKQQQYPDNLSVNIMYDSTLADQIYAGSDMFLMPSRYEPCGLSQLISFRYGTIPIVRETGGLNDTVVAYNEETGEGTGFSFNNYNAHDMLYTIERAVSFYEKKGIWNKLVSRVMDLDYSWHHSAKEYAKLYAELTGFQIEEMAEDKEESPVEIKIFKPDNDEIDYDIAEEKESITKTAEETENKMQTEVLAEDKVTEEVTTAEEIEDDLNIVNINLATAKELSELPGIGSAYAERIVDYRMKNGSFEKASEITKVRGIGSKKYEGISEMIDI